MIMIATEFQTGVLPLFGDKNIYINGIHRLNSYQYHLFSVLLVDEFSNVVPVDFFFVMGEILM